MSILSVTSEGQAAHEAIMVDSCLITRASTDPLDPTPTTVYDGPCLFKVEGRIPVTAPDAAGTQTALDRVVCKIPVSVTGVDLNDKITCVSSINPSLVGDTFYVVGLLSQSAASSQRIACTRRIR